MTGDLARGPELVGALSGRGYVCGEQIGDGALGVVYSARERLGGALRAVKILVESPIKGLLDRLGQLELDLESIGDPPIVRILDFGRAGNRAFIATELCDGHSAADALGHGSLAPDRVARIARELARALAAAHTARVSHQMITPSSVMLHPDGGVRLLGVGLLFAITAGDPQAVALLYTDKQVPELKLAFTDRADPRADIHALGGLMAHLITGHRPFPIKVEQILAQRGATKTAPIISRLNPAVSSELEAVIQRALNPDPRARFRTMLEFGSALDALETK